MKVFLILKIPQNLLVIHKIQTYTAAALSERFERFLIAVFSMELIMVSNEFSPPKLLSMPIECEQSDCLA